MAGDQLGTPRMVFDKTGALANVKRHDYLPFGEELSAGIGGRTTAQGYGAADGVRQKFTDLAHSRVEWRKPQQLQMAHVPNTAGYNGVYCA